MNDRMRGSIADRLEEGTSLLAESSAFEARLAGFLSVSAQALGVPFDSVQRVLMNVMRQRTMRDGMPKRCR